MPILTTKLYIPPLRPKVVLRPRLIERLNEGLHRRLTLIAAPAGFGKTTLVSEWINASAEYGVRNAESSSTLYSALRTPHLVAWLSLDTGDSDLIRFLTHLVAALQTIAPQMGAGVLGILQSLQQPPPEAILTLLLNEMSALSDHFVLVLDDYHVIEAAPNGHPPLGAVDQALSFLLEHMPPQMHMIITSREDPHLPLARYRARGQMTELRAADLRFTATEAADFLNQVMGLTLSAADIAALEERTEGWIAGLQLAALSVQGRSDVPGFIRAFTGDNRYIVDYLVEEVLQHQPPPVRNFLLQTAILERLNGPLCDAVTGQEEGSERLDALERGNFFVVPLDDKRYWYRYHQLFAEVLSAHLREEQPDQVATLHRRASVWYAANALPADAIRHALAAQDFASAADLIELAAPAMSRSRQETAVLGWLKSLPNELVRTRPVLSVVYAHLLLNGGKVDGVEDRLRDAERWLETTAGPHPSPPLGERPLGPGGAPKSRSRPAAETCPEQSRRMVVVDDEAFRRLPGMIAIARAGLALAQDDVPATMTYARRALDLAPEDDHLTRGGAAGFLGLASWTRGDLETAHRTYANGMASLQKAGNISDAINGAITLAAIRLAQGRLRQAMRTYEQALQLATEQVPEGAPILRGTADMYVGMSEIEREHNDLQAATQHLLRSKELGEHTGFPQNRYRWRIAMARIREAQGDLNGALDLLDEAERLYMSDFSPNVRPIAALKTRVWVAQGRLGEALDWAREQDLSARDDLSYQREFEHITLARVRLAQYQCGHADSAMLEAIGLLERLLQAAEAGVRQGSVIEILVLQAFAHYAQCDLPAALVPLERALTLAEPEGYIRIFVDEGQPMRLMLLEFTSFQDKLRNAHQPSMAQNTKLALYTDRILASFGNEPARIDKPLLEELSIIANPTLVPEGSQIQSLVEPLSQRELEVLRLFKTEMSGPEMAQQLVIGLSTIRTHTKRIYSKLNVNSRRAAVKRAIELNLL